MSLRRSRQLALCTLIVPLAHATPPNIVIEKFDLLPVFNGQSGLQVTAVNNNGDFCGYRGGFAPQEFRYLGDTPLLGSFGVTWGDINDSQVSVGGSFQVFPPFAIVSNGPFSFNSVPERTYFAINNDGWIVGRVAASFGPQAPVRVDDLGETELPGDAFWREIDNDGRVWGTVFSGDLEEVVFKTRFGPVQNLGAFGASGAKATSINRNGDWGGFTYSNSNTFPPTTALAVIGDVEHHIPTETGNDARTLAVTVDGQIIGTDRGLCTPACDGKVWVVKDGVRHNLDDEISAFLGFFPTLWNASAASETGWIIGEATDPRDNTFHFFRMKIQVDLDSDGDGLLDFWESENGGIDFNHDNHIDFNPFDHGARPDHKDLFIEVDSGDFPLSDTETSKVLFAFDNAPVDNPDGTTGIRLHIDRDQAGCRFPDPSVTEEDFPNGHKAFKAEHFGTPTEVGDPNAINILGAKAMVYRYCVLYDGLTFPGPKKRYNGTSEIGGNDFLVDFAATVFRDGFRDEDDRAATFMHEFGHTLGLRHGGKGDAIEFGKLVDFMGKPNYPSIMNYALAHPYPWSRKFWTLDYSREKLADLDENFLDETAGIRSTLYTNYSMPYGVGPAGARSVRLARLNGKKADFNANGSFQSSVAADLNFLGANASIVGTTLASPDQRMGGQNDWQSIKYKVITDTKETAHDITIAEGCPEQEGIDFLAQSVPSPCDEDINGDGLVDDDDFTFFIVAYNELLCDQDPGGGGDRPPGRSTEPPSPSPDCPADFNGDRLVDDADFTLFVVAYNELLCP